MKNITFVGAVTTLVLAGCAAPNTGIVQIADDTYMHAKQDRMAHSGSVVKAELYKEANAFCVSKGKKFSPINSTSQDAILYQASAGAEIQFTCK